MTQIGNYDFKTVEEEVLDFWKKKGIYDAAKKKGKGKKSFYFLDGPPYTSGKIHLGHAWNKSLKDSVLRYKRMAGFDVWDRAGYDMHGLPTEHATEKKLGIKGRDQIEKYGINKFIEECRKLCIHYRDEMNKDFMRIGIWMDLENAYQPITPEFIEGEWWLIKKAHENKRLYEGKRTMTWCAHDATALSKHELEYKTVTDNSIYLKFKIVGTQNEYLIVWTTTPWTIPFNLAVMVNPEQDYVKAKVDDEVWIVAKALTSFIPAVANKKFSTISEFKGEKLVGIKYEHPFRNEIKEFDEIAKTSPKLHTVVASTEYVDVSAGSGLVHCAPGCGPEDYEVGHQNGLPAFNELDEHGRFKSTMGKFSGMKAKTDDKKFTEELDKKGVLIATSPVEHEYPHCQRCKNPVVFRTTVQWFFKIEDLKENMRELNKSIYWMPEYAGSRQFDSWLANLRDNSITRQRYWGTPVPIWKCSHCDNCEVIGSREELKKKTGKLPDDLHKPSLDPLIIKCTKCKHDMKRIPDVLDVWIDSASASWNCLDYPANDKLFKKLYPPDFILEGIDQVRGWFNILFVASMVAMNKPAYKSVYMHGFINQAPGEKMSKSLGNAVSPQEVIEQYGADTMRYYLIGAANPGFDMNYNIDDMNVSYRNLGVIWNLHKFLIDMSETLGKNPAKLKPKLDLEEKYILSKLNSTINYATKAFDEYRLNEVPHLVENLLLELSRTYIQLVREKSSVGSEKEKEAVLYTIYTVFMESLKLFAPLAPFITEKMYQNVREAFKLKDESIHLFDWPKANVKEIDIELESSIEHAKQAIQAVLSAREKIKRGVRWPVLEITIVSQKDDVLRAIASTEELIKSQTNVKKIIFAKKFEKAVVSFKPDFSKLGPVFGKKASSILAKLVTMPHISQTVQKEGKATIMLDSEKIELTKEMFLTETALPSNWVSSEFSNGAIYLNAETNKELELEGYARELMRRIQSLRKEAGLQKNDEIMLFINADAELEKGLVKFKSLIVEKCGAKDLTFSGKGKVEKVEQIRDKEIKISFTKL